MAKATEEKTDKMATYAELAKAYEADVVTSARRSAKVAWIGAGVLAVVAAAQGLAMLALLPLHRIEPYVIRVDEATGAVDSVAKLNATSRTETEAVNKYMVGKYVRAREEFSTQLAPVNYKTVALMSAPPVANLYYEAFKPENPKSPLKVYAGGGNVNIRILNVSFLGPNIASVRYEKTIRANDAVSRSMWLATVTFRYSNAPMSEDDRLVNPIGFEVTDYRNDPEVGG